MTVLVNGEPGGYIDAADRGLQFGDGVFETLRLENGRPVLWSRHWARLCRGLDLLGIPRPDEQVCLDELAQVAPEGSSMAKLIVSRGPGPRGYAVPATVRPTRIVMGGAPLEAAGGASRLRVGVCRTRVARSPVPECKHLNRLENVLARREWTADWDEGLMLDGGNRVRCATQSNVFILEKGVLLTPFLKAHGVAGTRRGWILDHAVDFGLSAVEATLNVERVRRSDALFLTSARLGLRQGHLVGEGHRSPLDTGRERSVLERIREIGERMNALD